MALVLQSTRVFFAVRFAHVALQKGITRNQPEALTIAVHSLSVMVSIPSSCAFFSFEPAPGP
jgi:hypothetical protein